MRCDCDCQTAEPGRKLPSSAWRLPSIPRVLPCSFLPPTILVYHWRLQYIEQSAIEAISQIGKGTSGWYSTAWVRVGSLRAYQKVRKWHYLSKGNIPPTTPLLRLQAFTEVLIFSYPACMLQYVQLACSRSDRLHVSKRGTVASSYHPKG